MTYTPISFQRISQYVFSLVLSRFNIAISMIECLTYKIFKRSHDYGLMYGGFVGIFCTQADYR